LVDPRGDGLSVGFSIESWAGFNAFAHEGTYWAISQGMRRFGLPEFSVDWAIWKDGEGVIEGGRTETVTSP
jgi:hypothetical protein